MVKAAADLDNQRVALVVQYLGTHFYGWQRQLNQRTVQEELETAIAAVLSQKRVVIHAAGRTDTGVHAAAQVVHFDAQTYIPAHRWMGILNRRLPADIVIRAAVPVPATWHARFSATYRRYRYTLYTASRPNLFVAPLAWHYYHEPLDHERIQKALDPLVGRHHLAAFHRAGSKRPHSWVDVQEAFCKRQGDFLTIEVQASGFLYGMMRLLVGLLVQVGRGDRTPEEFTELWMSERREDVKYAAPPQGLCLLRVGYDDNPFPPEAWFDTQPQLVLPPEKPDVWMS
ncbi:tRNA pseudouridine(38-40) synthase TruA [Alkalinema sp. FACHB-956]|uniref:tRNA pseudouridine(38-40) synthase TruA n=1 Tax=Alkalinema sp. FACHB-956 TaxID=2692768 RepID=UPI0016896E8D|nr:tRNA pseudouridine(38-40) synthase TruA [Alkalinema sp. FACHB-956]MBD2325934.1 tRNA pseudouridine(38-40) synthase TruA [Alkalinema sp. FACHB-956]